MMKKNIMLVLMAMWLVCNSSCYADDLGEKVKNVFCAWTGLSAVSGVTYALAKWGNWSDCDAAKVARIRRYAKGVSIVASLPIASIIATAALVAAIGEGTPIRRAICYSALKPYEYMVGKPAEAWQRGECQRSSDGN